MERTKVYKSNRDGRTPKGWYKIDLKLLVQKPLTRVTRTLTKQSKNE